MLQTLVVSVVSVTTQIDRWRLLARTTVLLLVVAAYWPAETAAWQRPRFSPSGSITSEHWHASRMQSRNRAPWVKSSFQDTPPVNNIIPPISMPVWALSCPHNETMSIITYCTPVSSPKSSSCLALALYQGTRTRDAFASGTGILQLLTPAQAPLVPILGKQSGYTAGVDKRSDCAQAGWAWTNALLLPACALYLQIEQSTSPSFLTAPDHVVVLVQVSQVGVWKEGAVEWSGDTASLPALDASTVLYTGQLRQEGWI
jgi:hypothetical protein